MVKSNTFSKKISFALSPCPNDVFIISKFLLGKDSPFEFIFKDIDELNNITKKGEIPLVKASFGAWGDFYRNYYLLPVGSAMGFGVGPLLVAESPEVISKKEDIKVGLPGEKTTASFLFDYWISKTGFFKNFKKKYLRYDKIIPFLCEKKLDAGVIIHEGRFVYQRYGLFKIVDLGEFWERETESPVPLGGFFVKRDMPGELIKEIVEELRDSIKWAYENFEKVMPVLKKYAQEMDEETIKKHVETYVNRFTLFLEEKALTALEKMVKFLGINESLKTLIF